MTAERVPVSPQRRVRLRATDRIDHVIPRVAGGTTALENLALACVSGSLHKGARISAVDPETGNASELFHPRVDVWNEHFIAAPSGEILGRPQRPDALRWSRSA